MPKQRRPIKPITSHIEISWLAGLLEGEGSFVCQGDGRIRLALVMTDRDVVDRAGALMDLPVFNLGVRRAHHKPAFAIAANGPRAAYYMRLVLPYMGIRRAAAIRACLEIADASAIRHRERGRLLSQKVELDELIAQWNARPAGVSLRAFARSIGLTHTTVAKRLKNLSSEPVAVAAPELLHDSAWLAGILEGEGCFWTRGNRITAQVKMTDEDIVARVARLFGASYHRHVPKQPTYKPCFIVAVTGERCAAAMKAILPFMGERRARRIEECLPVHEARLSAKVEAVRPSLEAWLKRSPESTVVSIARQLGIHPGTYRKRLVVAGLYRTQRPRPTRAAGPAPDYVEHVGSQLASESNT